MVRLFGGGRRGAAAVVTIYLVLSVSSLSLSAHASILFSRINVVFVVDMRFSKCESEHISTIFSNPVMCNEIVLFYQPAC